LFLPMLASLCLHCIENPINVFPEMKLGGLVPISCIHVSVSGLYIPRIGLPIWVQQNSQTYLSWEYINRSQIHECGNGETEHYNSVLKNTEAAKFHFWDYINWNQTYIRFSEALHLQCGACQR
jgi:hypothetical protein